MTSSIILNKTYKDFFRVTKLSLVLLIIVTIVIGLRPNGFEFQDYLINNANNKALNYTEVNQIEKELYKKYDIDEYNLNYVGEDSNGESIFVKHNFNRTKSSYFYTKDDYHNQDFPLVVKYFFHLALIVFLICIFRELNIKVGNKIDSKRMLKLAATNNLIILSVFMFAVVIGIYNTGQGFEKLVNINTYFLILIAPLFIAIIGTFMFDKILSNNQEYFRELSKKEKLMLSCDKYFDGTLVMHNYNMQLVRDLVMALNELKDKVLPESDEIYSTFHTVYLIEQSLESLPEREQRGLMINALTNVKNIPNVEIHLAALILQAHEDDF